MGFFCKKEVFLLQIHYKGCEIRYKKEVCKRKLLFCMAQDGIEPPTQGFSVLCSTD